MSPQTLLHATVLFASAAVAVWTFIVIRGRSDDAPGRAALGGLMLAVALWCVTSGLHAIVTSLDTRVALSEIQYFGIAPAAPLWMLFASQYARLRWTSDPVLRAALWIIPIATVLLALTNPMHRLLWTDIVPVDAAGGARLQYVHGPWFWVAVTFSYFCLAVGTIVLVRAMKGSPVGPRPRVALALAGVALPWMANVLYLAGALPAGFDPTPVALALTGACILLSIYHHRLFTLVPIARDLVVESMDAAVFVLGPGRKVVDFNPAAHRLTGCTDESAGEPIDRIVPWWRQASANGRLAAGSPVVVDVGSSSLEVQMTAIHDAHETRAGWVVVMRDIAERRAAEAERSALERRMQEQQRAESLSVLTAGVAHDFKNLLTGILGHAELLALKSEPGSATRESAEAVVHGAQRAAGLVEKMLAYAGQRPSAPEAVNLDALLRDMDPLLQASHGRKFRITCAAAAAEPLVTGDLVQLRQVLLNLVANAAEASRPGGAIEIRAGVEQLTESALARMTVDGRLAPGPCAFLEVADTGRGLDDATLARAFDPFFSTKANGRGLGLTAVRGIVRSHGGAVKIASTPNRGTTVTVWLPLTSPNA